jgi:hypothetical protein
MPKITEISYFLPEIIALNGVQNFNTGTTRPMLVRGVCKQTGDKSDYVVKFRNGTRMSINSSCNELVASFIAMELDLYVAEPAIIDIVPEFVDTLIGMDGYKNALNSPGFNFGCKYVEGLFEFTNNQKLTTGQYFNSQQIFSFDIFISNADRRVDKQNMLTDGEKILIFDHELAFGFIWDIIKNPIPWLITQTEMSWIKKHYFYSILKGKEHNLDTFVDKLSTLDGNFWGKLYQLIPDEWHGEHLDKIKNNLSLLVENRTHFKEELKRILS